MIGEEASVAQPKWGAWSLAVGLIRRGATCVFVTCFFLQIGNEQGRNGVDEEAVGLGRGNGADRIFLDHLEQLEQLFVGVVGVNDGGLAMDSYDQLQTVMVDDHARDLAEVVFDQHISRVLRFIVARGPDHLSDDDHVANRRSGIGQRHFGEPLLEQIPIHSWEPLHEGQQLACDFHTNSSFSNVS